MSLNNGGDTIEFLDPSGDVIQTFTYPAVKRNEVVTVDR